MSGWVGGGGGGGREGGREREKTNKLNGYMAAFSWLEHKHLLLHQSLMWPLDVKHQTLHTVCPQHEHFPIAEMIYHSSSLSGDYTQYKYSQEELHSV